LCEKKSDPHTGNLMRHDLQKQSAMGVPGIAPDDPRFLEFPMAKAGDVPKPKKVYAAGCCYSCSYLPDDPQKPPRFCPECGAWFVPYQPEGVTSEGEDE